MSDNSLVVRSLADAMTADKEINGYKNKVYKAQSDEHKGELISQSIRDKSKALRNNINVPKVDLSNTPEVQERVFAYLEACEIAKAFPSVMGLSTALGCTRQNLNQWLLTHPGHPTTEFVGMTKDSFADVLVNASLYNNANAVQAIFQLKNHFEHADRVEIAPVVQNNYDSDSYNAEEIRKRYVLTESEEENGAD